MILYRKGSLVIDYIIWLEENGQYVKDIGKQAIFNIDIADNSVDINEIIFSQTPIAAQSKYHRYCNSIIIL